jgi:hypothetical protein
MSYRHRPTSAGTVHPALPRTGSLASAAGRAAVVEPTELAALNLAGVTGGRSSATSPRSRWPASSRARSSPRPALPVLLAKLLGVTGLIGGFPVSLPAAPVGAVTGACAVIAVLAAMITSARAMRGRAGELAGPRE